MPEVAGEFVALSPASGNYPPDGAFSVVLLIGVLAVPLLLLAYCTGRLPAGVRSCDAVSRSYELVASPSRGGVRTAALTSKFGGVLSLAALVTTLALVLEVLVNYTGGGDFGLEASTTLPAVDNAVFSGEDAAVDIRITAQRLPGAAYLRYGCRFTDYTPSGLVRSSLASLEGTPAGTNASSPDGVLTCSYRARAASLRVLVGPYTTGLGALRPTLQVGVGGGLQITGWEVRIADGSPSGSYSRGYSSGGPVPLDASRGRLHDVAVTLTPATYTDRGYVLTSAGAAGTVYRGFRAAFPAYTLANNTAASAQDDRLQLTFALSTQALSTVRTPRFTGLQLLGVLCGLAVGSLQLWAFLHEAGDAGCDAPALTPAQGRSCACLRRGYVSSRAVRYGGDGGGLLPGGLLGGGGGPGGGAGADTGFDKLGPGGATANPLLQYRSRFAVHPGGGAGGGVWDASEPGRSTHWPTSAGDEEAVPATLADAAARSAVLSRPMVPYSSGSSLAGWQQGGGGGWQKQPQSRSRVAGLLAGLRFGGHDQQQQGAAASQHLRASSRGLATLQRGASMRPGSAAFTGVSPLFAHGAPAQGGGPVGSASKRAAFAGTAAVASSRHLSPAPSQQFVRAHDAAGAAGGSRRSLSSGEGSSRRTLGASGPSSRSLHPSAGSARHLAVEGARAASPSTLGRGVGAGAQLPPERSIRASTRDLAAL